MNLLQQIEQEQIDKVSNGKTMPEFGAGDTLRVNFRIVEGANERLQAFEGVCIARKNRGINSSFTVRKLSHGEGVERVFPLFSPRVDSVEVMRRGAVRRAKLYYLRGLTGKAARIVEKRDLRGDAIRAAAKAEAKQAEASKLAAKNEAASKKSADKKAAPNKKSS